MIDSNLRTALGDRFEFEQSESGVAALRREDRALLREVGFQLESDGDVTTSELGGRNALLSLRAGGEELLLRRFTHGGLLRWLTGRRYLDPERPFVEAWLSERLLAAGIATPQVVAARAVRVRGGGWKLDLVTRRVPGGADLDAVLRACREREARARLLAAFGAWLRRLHGAGFLHADLHLKNVLVSESEGEPRLWVLDLDRSVLKPALSERERTANLARLVRYVWRRRSGLQLRSSDFARVLAAYAPERGERRTVWRAVAARTRSTLALHRAGWWLESRAARAQAMGDGAASSVTRG